MRKNKVWRKSKEEPQEAYKGTEYVRGDPNGFRGQGTWAGQHKRPGLSTWLLLGSSNL